MTEHEEPIGRSGAPRRRAADPQDETPAGPRSHAAEPEQDARPSRARRIFEPAEEEAAPQQASPFEDPAKRPASRPSRRAADPEDQSTRVEQAAPRARAQRPQTEREEPVTPRHRAVEPPPVPTGATVTERLDDAPNGRKAWWLALPLVLALGGGAWYLSQREDTPAQPQTAASPSASVPASASAPPTVSRAPGQVPGPGTVATVKKHLTDEGFTCAEEGQAGMDSWMCTHYTSDPVMMAYVGGAKGSRLGRVALNVQDGKGGKNPKALALQEYLAGQVAADDKQRDALLKAVRAGTEEEYAKTEQGGIVARGSSDGSIVSYVDRWVPDRAMPVSLLPAKPLAAELDKLGYTCKGTDDVTCERTEKEITHSIDYRVSGMEVTYLKVKSQAGAGATLTDAAPAEVKQVTSLFQQGPKIQQWLAKHTNEKAGATGYQDGMALDWYPGSSQAGGAAAIFYLREACWTDSVESC
ncbi:hypothetical protein GCM10027030_17750 [Luteococcus sediminum]